jgi:peroxiredoxin
MTTTVAAPVVSASSMASLTGSSSVPVVGELAPDFSLKAHDGSELRLSMLRDQKNVLLVFYPLDFSPTCSLQLPEFSHARHDFAALNTVVYGINRDSVYTHKAWAYEYMIEIPLLADLKSEVARLYGVYQEDKGYSGRASFLIDINGVLQIAHVEANSGTYTLRADDVVEFLKQRTK